MLRKLTARLGLVDVRTDIVAAMRWAIRNEPLIHYTMASNRDDWLARPKTLLKTLPLYTDCSGLFTFCYRAAGALDPNGLSYRVLGWTGTLIGHGHQISRASVLPGDGVIWIDPARPHDGVHVAMALDKGAHTLGSHGGERGPIEISYDAENGYHVARGCHATFWRFPTTVAEAKKHTPNGYVQPPIKATPNTPAQETHRETIRAEATSRRRP